MRGGGDAPPPRPSSRGPAPEGRGGFGIRIYRLLMLAFPSAFREDCGTEVLFVVRVRRDRLRRRGAGLRELIRFWAFHLRDLVANATAERLAGWRRRSSSIPLPGKRSQPMLQSLVLDLKHSLRRLATSPGFTAAALLLVGLGIGANAAMFSIVDGLLWRPMPFEDPDRLVWVYQDSDDGEPSSSSYPAYLDMKEFDDVFSGVAAMLRPMTGTLMSATGETRSVRLAWVAEDYPRVLGLENPALGRWFVPEEDDPDGPPAAVISHELWQSRYGGDPTVVGETVRLNGTPVPVVGVGPPGYRGALPGVEVDFWLSISAMGDVGGSFYRQTLDARSDHWFLSFARLRPGVSTEQAQAAMDVLSRRLAADFPEFNEGREITVFPFHQVRIHPSADGELYPGAGLLMGVVALVLILACSNLGNLLLARATARGREVAVRTALGASKGRLVRLLLTESVLVSVGGGIVGLAIALGAGRLLEAFPLPLPLPVTLGIAVDMRVFGFAMALAVGTGILFGLVPALRASSTDPVTDLKDPDESLGRGKGRRARSWFALRNVLVVVQVAISLVLLVGAGLLVRSLSAARRADPGFADDNLAIIQTDVRHAGYTDSDALSFYRRFVERIQGLPGIEAVTQATRIPLTPSGGTSTLVVEGYQPPSGTGSVEVRRSYVAPAYFETMGIPILHGRGFRPSDNPDNPTVSVVNETFARRYYGTADAVGRRYRHQGDPDSWVTIVGVVEDVTAEAPGEPPVPFYYRSLSGIAATRLYTVVRADRNPTAVAGMVRDELRDMDAAVPVYELGTMEDHLAEALEMQRAAGGLIGGFGLLALILASLGLYSVVSFSVTRRTAEVGIRMALGARRGDVIRMVVGRMMVLVAVGVIIGWALSWVATPVLGSMLYDVAPADPMTFAGVSLVLAAVALLAAWVPARRAARIDPMSALRRT